MSISRRSLVILCLLGLIGFALPALALANGSPSASGNQYTDPFGSSSGGQTTKKTTTPSPPTTTATPPPTTPAAPTPAPPAPTATATTGTSPGSTTAPTATTAASTTAASASGKGHGKTLPFTGYDGRLAALLGAALVFGGAGLRLRSRRA